MPKTKTLGPRLVATLMCGDPADAAWRATGALGPFVASDFVEAYAYQTSGAALNFGYSTPSSAQAVFGIMRLGD